MVVIVQVTQNIAAAVVVAADADDNKSPSFVYKTSSSSSSWSIPGGWTVMMTSQHLEQFSSEDR